jgi:hypothetical protein
MAAHNSRNRNCFLRCQSWEAGQCHGHESSRSLVPVLSAEYGSSGNALRPGSSSASRPRVTGDARARLSLSGFSSAGWTPWTMMSREPPSRCACGADAGLCPPDQLRAPGALPVDRLYWISAVHLQRRPDSLDVIVAGGGDVASGPPRRAGAGRGEQDRRCPPVMPGARICCLRAVRGWQVPPVVSGYLRRRETRRAVRRPVRRTTLRAPNISYLRYVSMEPSCLGGGRRLHGVQVLRLVG